MITKENLMDNEAATRIRLEIEKLISSYKALRDSKTEKGMKDISEANVRADFIDRLFDILGWAVNNPDEYDREHFIRGAGFADIALKLNNKPVIFVEAKRFGAIPHSKDVKGDWTLEERQAILYAAGKHCKWAVLTNFEKLRVFNAMTGLTVLNLESVDDYKNRLWDIIHLTKEFVISDKIERLGAREEKEPIDREFLGLLNKWRIELASDIYLNNFLNEGKPPDLSKLFPDYKKHEHDPRYRKFFESRREILRKRLDFSVLKDEKGNFDIEKLKSAVQRILDRLIIIRWAEDHLLLEDSNILEGRLRLYTTAGRYNPLYEALFSDGALFDKFNDIHNGEIFRRGLYYDRITVSDDVLKRIIEEMTSYSFRKFDFDILGNTYETYLGNTLYLKDDNTFDLKPSQETRKESGIYYTPPYVVDYIVKNTLGALLKDKTPEQVERIRVLDPACGSGSFLIKAYDCFANHYEEKNRAIKARIDEHVRKGMLFETSESTYSGYEASILMNNIHGVDLDSQAAEIAAVNLMLKALKPNEMLPPILGETIKVGNSLISGSEEELKKYFGEEWRAKKPFNWDEEFADVFGAALPEGERGFDVVIGNPPYITLALGKKQKFVSDEELAYFTDKYPNSMEYKGNTYTLFIERAIQYLKMNGMLSFIIPNTILSAYHFRDIRAYILDTCKILQIVDIHDKVFKDAEIGGNTILILEREKNNAERDNNKVKIIKIDDAEQFNKKSFAIEEINQNIFKTIPDKKFLLNKSDLTLIGKLDIGCLKLGDIATFYQGIITGDNKKYLSDKPEPPKHQKIIRGKDIERYSLKFGGIYVYFDKDLLWSNTDENMFLVDEKIISRQTSDHLVATYDNEKYFSLDSTHVIIPTGVNTKYLLAIFNSKLLNYYYQIIVPEVGRTFAQVKVVNLKQLPIKAATSEVQQEFIALVDRMLELNKQLNTINADFHHYLNLRPHSMVPLRSFMDALPVGDKEVLKDHKGKHVSTVEAEKFQAFDILEEGEWLVFVVGYSYMSGKGKPLSSSGVRALRLRIQDNSMRKFIFYSLKDTAPGKLGSGNILEQLQKLKLPRLVTNGEGNRRAVEELMSPFLVEVAKKEALEREIKETDDAIDKKVYALYGLTDEEIKIIEEQCKK